MNRVALGDLVLTNARIVLANEVLEGSVRVDGGVITDIGTPSRTGTDLDGDYLIPGLVELHTDHLETHYAPRPKVRWNPVAAVQAHDAQIAASGITTVLDAIRIGLDEQTDIGAEDMRTLAGAIAAGNAAGRLRAEHFIHLRCEVSAPDCLDSFLAIIDDPQVRLASLMDHAPGEVAATVKAVNHPHVVALIDFSHAYIESTYKGLSFYEEIAAMAPVTGHLHVHDSFGRPQGFYKPFFPQENTAMGMGDLHMPLGWGDIDWDHIFGALQFLPETVMMMEIGRRHRSEQPESLRRARQLARLDQPTSIAAQ